eukprot:PLAT14338.2.p1 GENE.PLAT14338.2~~PLAT14338.2.p1  ORF type:complete len:205 (-),score=89.06 PLAT14338.2:122-736(-)
MAAASKASPPHPALDIVKQVSMYEYYHSDWRNKVIHFVFVPFIIYAFMLMGSFVKLGFHPMIASVAAGHAEGAFEANITWLILAPLTVYYILLDRFSGALLSLLMLAGWASANTFVNTHSAGFTWLVIILLQAVGWGMQIVVGHGMFEGRAPALTQSLGQVFISPLTLLLDVLFAVGYNERMSKDIKAAVRHRARLEEIRRKTS